MRPVIYPYSMASMSSKALSSELTQFGSKRVYPDRAYTPYPGDLIINWGFSRAPIWDTPYTQWLNRPEACNNAANKLNAFRIMKENGVSIPEFTTDSDEVWHDLSTNYTIQWFARTKLRGHSGKGIEPIKGGTEYGSEGRAWPSAPLYTKYIQKDIEYRVHVFKGKVIDIQQKKQRKGVESDDVIRNHGSGWVFCRQNINQPSSELLNTCIKAVECLGLDFGAVDVTTCLQTGKEYVLEVNTAPALEGTTLVNYTNNIIELLGDSVV